MERQEISSLLFFWSLANILGIRLAETFGIPQISVKADWTAQKRMPICLAMSRSRIVLSYMIRLCTSSLLSCVVASLGCTDRPLTATLSIPLLNSPCCKTENHPQGFKLSRHEFPSRIWLLLLQLYPFSKFNTPFHCLQRSPEETYNSEMLFVYNKDVE